MALKACVSLLALGSSALAADLQPIVVKGSKFFYNNGTEFFMKGVAYQQDDSAPSSSGVGDSSATSYTDPLADPTACKRDIPLLQELGTNIIRTYSINPDADHSECMQMLQDAGIYVISDLGSPTVAINRADPAWNVELLQRYQAVVDSLAQYSNVVGFFAGNEVPNNSSNTGAAAYVKAAVRDTKAYIKQKGYRWMGVGYAASDDVNILYPEAEYFNCGNQTDAVDFWGFNVYSWCGDSNFASSSYNSDIEFFTNYSVPSFFAEYGCNLPNGAAGRTFSSTTALYEKNMTEVFSGGIVYMYFQTANDYGLVEIQNGNAEKMDDFYTLEKAVNAADPTGPSMDSYTTSNQPASCPALSDHWHAAPGLPPTPNADLCSCMTASRTCVRAANLDTKAYADIFGYICGQEASACKGISGNTTTGVYGAYSMCSVGQQLDYVLDAYYKSQNSASSACDFNGQATLQTAAQNSSCTSELAKASSYNSEVATATAAVSSSKSTSSSSKDSFAMPGATVARVGSFGDYAVGLYMVVSVVVGAGMVWM